jgi:lipopolysaccharide/colanic/teichoic acid biosynthesis glycosyltransferase
MHDDAMRERRRQRLLLTGALLGSDAAMLAVALLVAHRLALARSIWHAPPLIPPALWIVIPITIGIFALGRLYVLDELFEGSIEYGRVVYGATLASLSVIILGFWGKLLGEVAPSRTLIILVWALSIFLVGGGRFALRRAVRFLRRRGFLTTRVVIVGIGASGLGFAKHFEQSRHSGVKVVGFVDDFLAPGTPVLADLKVLGPPSALDDILDRTGAHEVIIVPTATAWESFQDLTRRMSSMNGYTVRLAPGSHDLLATTMRAQQFASIPMLTVERVRITGLDRLLKSALDYGLTLLLLPYAVPAVLVAAAALSMSGTSPFRRMQLVGRGGVPRTVFMLNGTAAAPAVRGLVKRIASDRLPLLLSVLLGHLSIVGPRPIPVDQRRSYTTWLPSLLTVRPGVTGPWLARPSASIEEEMEASLFYIRNYTIWLDAEVLLRSVARLLSRNGAAEAKAEDSPLGERAAAHH